MRLIPATESHLTELMTWFSDASSCTTWAGPGFRFPFEPGAFKEDLKWNRYESVALVDEKDTLVGFGQLFEKYGRIHLARLVIHPEYRRRGYGRALIQKMLDKGAQVFPLKEFSLNVYANNEGAIACYRGLGFTQIPSPERDPGFSDCYFMVMQRNSLSGTT